MPLSLTWERTRMAFRKEETVNQILALRWIMEEVKQSNMEAVQCFIDFHKVFYSTVAL